MSIQSPCAMPVRSLILQNIVNVATPVRKELIEIAAFDLHRAARSYKPRHIGSGAHPWYIPQFAVLQALR
jgi:hypothetical protein